MDEATRYALAGRDGGDPGALAEFVQSTHMDVWRMCAALIGPEAADDLTQETFLRALRSLSGFEARSSIRTWLFGIARRACADHIRTVTRQRRADGAFESPSHHPDPAGGAGGSDLLSRLPPDRRAAFVLTQLYGLSYAEAADMEDVPIGTIRSRVARARVDLADAVSIALAS